MSIEKGIWIGVALGAGTVGRVSIAFCETTWTVLPMNELQTLDDPFTSPLTTGDHLDLVKFVATRRRRRKQPKPTNYRRHPVSILIRLLVDPLPEPTRADTTLWFELEHTDARANAESTLGLCFSFAAIAAQRRWLWSRRRVG